jgi:hypothetical protein
MRFTNFLGRQVEVEPDTVVNELLTLIEAAGTACAITGTEPELEALRHARLAFMKALERERSVAK